MHPNAPFVIGCIVLACALCAISVPFPARHKEAEQKLYDEAVARRGMEGAGAAVASPA